MSIIKHTEFNLGNKAYAAKNADEILAKDVINSRRNERIYVMKTMKPSLSFGRQNGKPQKSLGLKINMDTQSLNPSPTKKMNLQVEEHVPRNP